MKIVILADCLGSRLSEETAVRSKPMVEAGAKPMLCRIILRCARLYRVHGLLRFLPPVVEREGALGYGVSVSRTNPPDPAFWEGRRVLLTGHTGQS